MTENFEDVIIARMTAQECIENFDPEIQAIFYDRYGKNLEALPETFFHANFSVIDLMERLLKLPSVKHQKIILCRFGIVTGSVMTLEEVGEKFDITRERVRLIESNFIRLPVHLARRKKIRDFYSAE